MEGPLHDLFNDVDTWPDQDTLPDVDGSKIDEGGGVVMISLTNVDPLLHVTDTTKGIGITPLGVTADVAEASAPSPEKRTGTSMH